MPKYFIDTEFIEGFHKPLFGKRRHFIDLISIGIVCDDGRKYYAISNEFREKDADDWVKKNVISKLPRKRVDFYDSPREKSEALYWKSNARIAHEIKVFVSKHSLYDIQNLAPADGEATIQAGIRANPPEFYGYYCDYDWVLFCSLFGRMIDLPKGFPMYCIDLKQTLDEKAAGLTQLECTTQLVSGATNLNWAATGELPRSIINIDDWSFEQKLAYLKARPEYPKQLNEHNALADANWNYGLYQFLQNV